MNREDRKKQRERVFVDLFLKHREMSSLICRDHEEPDFLLSRGLDTVGIEVTQLFQDGVSQSKGSRLKAGESIRAKSISKLAKQYYDSGNPPLDISFAQYVDEDLIGSSFEFVLDSIQQFAKKNTWDEGNQKLELPGGQLLTVYWLRLPSDAYFVGYSNWKLIDDSVGFAASLTKDIALDVLSSKKEKAKTYLKKCDRVWLLMIADRLSRSGKFDCKSNLPCISSDEANPFEEVWVLDFPNDSYSLLT